MINEWVVNRLNLLDDFFTLDVFKGVYKSVRQFTLNRNIGSDQTKKKSDKNSRFRSISKKKKKQEEEAPENELTRFMFLDLIVRIATLKFKFIVRKGE